MRPQLPNTLACSLRDFFSDHLPRLRGLSPHTIQSYRDSLVLLLRFVAAAQHRPVALLDLEDLGVRGVTDFLNHLERERSNTASTRNVRLAAIHSFFRYVASEHPDRLEHCQRVLGVPFKRARQRTVEYFEYEEIQAVLSAIDRSSADGRRDYVLLATMFNTGARVQEVVDLRGHDLQLTKPFQVRLFGKGRKERYCPLWPETAGILRDFVKERRLDLRSSVPIFCNRGGEPLTRWGVRYLLQKHLDRAKVGAPHLEKKRLHPHSMRHSTAIHLLKSGVDLVTISKLLGHRSPNTTNRYTAIDLDMKRKAIALAAPVGKRRRTAAAWRTDPAILEWLEAL